ncbi:MAG: NAD(P)H-hydrate dehydratase [Clostridia bacterium]|nr:NAD(P)H-hydrate dehydratase [Clostridia bacterium]
MDYVLDNAQMREADEYTINGLGVPSLVLMERAGEALAKRAEESAPTGAILCVCGGGNNGGDGFVCARLLKACGREVTVVCFAERKSDDCAENHRKFLAVGGEVVAVFPKKAFALVVDCLLGTGFKGAPSEAYAAAIKEINGYKARGARVLSADIPSGVHGDGRVQKTAVCADETLCIGEYKTGVFFGDGIDFAGKVLRADIGIRLPREKEKYATLVSREEIAALLPKRKRNTHKGCYGRAAIVAGSVEYTGAAYLATAACLRSGAGYTALFVPKGLLTHYMLKAPEALLVASNEGDRYEFNARKMQELTAYDSVAYGMGMGASIAVAEGALWLLGNYTGTLILDADALNSFAFFGREKLAKAFAQKKCDVVLTPHIKEFARLSEESVGTISEKGFDAPEAFAKTHGVTVLLKNAVSVVTDGERTALNTAGTAGQAKGGSGDVLAGVIAGLCAQGLSGFDGARAGAYLVGKAAEIAAKEQGEYSLLATDTIERLGKAFLSLYE